jgi:hypothetical protein
MAKLTYKKVYDTLSKINVNEHTAEKMGFTYISWSQAVRIFTENFPEWSLKWHGTADANGVLRDVVYYEGGTASVTCSVTMPDGDGGELKKEMWLPVTDFKNQAISYPDSMAINTAKMRCLTKNLAMWGLGLYVYSGLDDIFYEAPSEAPPPPAPKKATPKKKKSKAKGPSAEELKKKIIAESSEMVKGGWEPDKALGKEIKDAVATMDVEVMSKMLVKLQEGKQVALTLNNDKEEEK